MSQNIKTYFNPITRQTQFEPVNICQSCKNICGWRNSLQSQNCKWISLSEVKTINAEYDIKLEYEQCRFCGRMHLLSIQCACAYQTENKKKK